MRRLAVGFGLGLAAASPLAAGSVLCAASTTRRLDSVLSVPVDSLPAEAASTAFDYDLVVIGGGSGGIACAKRASDLGAKVALCDFVRESPQGTTWGLGGTCVNVGCIPKKLMHAAALHGDVIRNHANHFGWHVEGERVGEDGVYPAAKMICDWEVLRQNVVDYIHSLNFGYRTTLRAKGVTYLNTEAKFLDPHTLQCRDKKGEVKTVTARRVLLATGGRPTIPTDVPGAVEFGVTSDDIFRWKKDPGATCVVGASYVALECAGFLHGIGRPVSLLIRSIPLRGFDTDMASKVVQHMENIGIKIHKQTVPVAIAKRPDGRLDVTMEEPETGKRQTQVFDTCLFATGRKPETGRLGLSDIGLQLTKSGHVVVDRFDRTSVPHIYAIGDIRKGGPELTPVAIKAGIMLAERLYGKKDAVMDYETVPTTVFTPLEYGCVGLSEDAALAKFGADGISVFHTYTSPVEWNLPHLDPNSCYFKLIVEKASDRVLGFHALAPNAGEITQPMAIALKKGCTKADIDATVGIHPTLAEDIVSLKVTKESGADAKKQGC